MATYRYIAYDISHDLKQLYDDAQVSLASIAYWMHIVGDFYRRQRIERYDAHQYINILPFSISSFTFDAMGAYVTLPFVYDYTLDKGVDFVETITTSGTSRCSYTTVSQLGRIAKIREEIPTSTNKVFFIVGHRLYVKPLNSVYDGANATVNVGLYTSFDTTKPINLDDEFLFPQDMLPRLKADLLGMGRLVLSMPDNSVNDGSPNATQRGTIPNQPITSPDTTNNEAQQ